MNARVYSCKNEELPIIGGYIAFSLKRDLADFATFSPKFNDGYVSDFRRKIVSASDLLSPRIETVELKITTNSLYTAFHDLNGLINRMAIYIKMAKTEIPVTFKDFGIIALRRKIRQKDAEGVEQNLHIVLENTHKYLKALKNEGLNDDFVAKLTNLDTSIAGNNQRQYEIISHRKELVQNNIFIFNDLYLQIANICDVGKVLYRKENSLKLQEYTFRDLLKKVRIVHESTNQEK
jgi:hypothetical protein